jgi:hypothetical protein
MANIIYKRPQLRKQGTSFAASLYENNDKCKGVATSITQKLQWVLLGYLKQMYTYDAAYLT